MATPPLVLRDETTGRLVVVQPSDRPDARGADSRLCDIRGVTDHVALIPVAGGTYPAAAGKKLRALVEKKIDFAGTGIAAPTAVLRDPNDRSPDAPASGFVCRKATGPGFDALTSPAERRRLGIDPWGEGERARAAVGLVKVFKAAETLGIVLADHNLPNWLFETSTGRIARIDPLAFAFEHRGWHGTGTVRPEALAPELQRHLTNDTLADQRLGREHERFSLAAMLFLLSCDAWPSAYGRAAPAAVERKEFACISAPAGAVVSTEVQLAYFDLPAPLQMLLVRGLTGAASQRPGPDLYLAELRKMLPARAPAPRKPWRFPFDRRKSAMAVCGVLALGWGVVNPPQLPPVEEVRPVQKAPPVMTTPAAAMPDDEKPREPKDPDRWKSFGTTIGDTP